MDAALLASRLVLALVFLVAGVAKLFDREGSRQAIVAFGLPLRLSRPGAVLLPVAEIGAAVALVPNASARWGALAALALLTMFIGGISANMARGRAPDCHCFGQLRAEPIGASTLIRNAVLAGAAIFVLVWGWSDTGTDPVDWFTRQNGGVQAAVSAGLAGALVLAAEVWSPMQLFRQHGRLLLGRDDLETLVTAGAAGAPAPAVLEGRGLAVGSPAPPFVLTGLHGETLALDALRAAGSPVLLFFVDPDCIPCGALMREIGAWQHDHAGRVTIAVISRGAVEPNRARTAPNGVANVVLQQDREVALAYEYAGTPGAVIVNADGTVGSEVVAGADGLRALLGRIIGAPLPSSGGDRQGAMPEISRRSPSSRSA
jgi:uncharacterized membrane protein YphA (DoxX/SURF4 family)